MPQKGMFLSAAPFVIISMRRWKAVGSVSGRDNSVRSNKSRDDSPFESFHQNLRNKSEDRSLNHDRTFCQEYMEKKRELYRNITFENAQSEQNFQQGREDMFTSMRNILKDESIQSRLTSHSRPSSKVQTSDHNDKGKDRFQKMASKMRTLKKEQNKLKQTLQKQLAGIKNILYQIDDVFHTQSIKERPEASQKTYDPQILKEILTQAVSIEKFFGQMDRKKNEIMSRLQND